MKYIVFQLPLGDNLVREVPIMFPNGLTHALVAEALATSPEMQGAKVLSAGEFNSFDLSGIKLFGESESLGVKSRPEDSKLLPMYDYTGGVL